MSSISAPPASSTSSGLPAGGIATQHLAKDATNNPVWTNAITATSGTINGTAIGATSRSTGDFTVLSARNSVTGVATLFKLENFDNANGDSVEIQPSFGSAASPVVSGYLRWKQSFSYAAPGTEFTDMLFGVVGAGVLKEVARFTAGGLFLVNQTSSTGELMQVNGAGRFETQVKSPILTALNTGGATGVDIKSFSTLSKTFFLGENAGTLIGHPLGNPDYGLFLFSHFIGNTLEPFGSSVSGAGSSVGLTASTTFSGGTASIVTGTATTGRAAIRSSMSSLRLLQLTGQQRDVFVALGVLPSALLNSATDYAVLRIGFMNSDTGAPTNGVFFLIDPSLGAVRAVCVNGGTSTIVSTALTGFGVGIPATFKIVIGGGVGASFYINNGLVATIATNIPNTVGSEVGIGASLIKTTGTSSFNYHFDYLGGGIRQSINGF